MLHLSFVTADPAKADSEDSRGVMTRPNTCKGRTSWITQSWPTAQRVEPSAGSSCVRLQGWSSRGQNEWFLFFPKNGPPNSCCPTLSPPLRCGAAGTLDGPVLRSRSLWWPESPRGEGPWQEALAEPAVEASRVLTPGCICNASSSSTHSNLVYADPVISQPTRKATRRDLLWSIIKEDFCIYVGMANAKNIAVWEKQEPLYALNSYISNGSVAPWNTQH